MEKNKKISREDEDKESFMPSGDEERGWIAGTHFDCSKLQHIVNARLYEMFRVPIVLLFMIACLVILVITHYVAIAVMLAIPVVIFTFLECTFGDLREFKTKHASAIKYLKNTPITYIFKPMKKNIELPPPVDYVLTDQKNISRGNAIFEFGFKDIEKNDRIDLLYEYFKDKVAAFPALIECDIEYYDAKSMVAICLELANDELIPIGELIYNAINVHDKGAIEITDYHVISGEKHQHQNVPDTPEILELKKQMNDDIQQFYSQGDGIDEMDFSKPKSESSDLKMHNS